MISIRDLVQMTCDRMGVAFDEHVDIAEERLGKDASYSLATNKLRDTLGWEDQISLEEGVDDIIKWVDTHFEELKTQEMNYIHKA